MKTEAAGYTKKLDVVMSAIVLGVVVGLIYQGVLGLAVQRSGKFFQGITVATER